METWKCDVCAKSFTGLVCFKQHEASEKHKKKMQMISGVTFEASNPVIPDSANFNCSVCTIFISGWENFQKHVNSLEHAIMIQRKNNDLLDQSISSTFKLKTENNQLMESTIPSISPVTTLKPYAECKPCQKQFSGPEPYQQHLASAGHFKKCGQSKIMLNDEADSKVGDAKTNSNLSNDPQSSISAFERCGICQLSFTGPLHYQMHLESDSHRKKVGNQFSGSSFDENHSKIMLNDEADSKVGDAKINSDLYDDPQSSISAFERCGICQLSFTGPLHYQMHLESDSHRKKVGNQLPGSSFDENLSVLNCSICDMTFSGPIPYQQHLISNGHKKKINAARLSTQLAATGSLFPLESITKALEQCNMNNPRWYCDICKKQCSGPIPYNSHMISRDHSKKLRVLAAEENLKKMKESSTFPHVENNKTDSDLSNEVTSSDHLNSVIKKEMQIKESSTFPHVENNKTDSDLSNEVTSSDHLNSVIKKEMQIKESSTFPHVENNKTDSDSSNEVTSSDHLNSVIKKEMQIKESSTFPHVENNKTDSDLSDEVTSSVHLNSIIKKEIQESSIEYKINDLDVNIKGKDSKILSDKFQMNVDDLLALPNRNIIPPEKIDVPVFGPEDEIVFSSPKKCEQEVLSEMDEVKNVYDTEKIFHNNCLKAEKS
ncbi:uncharacterized protein LOC129959431 [Argiope bruennichi]|uniref:uncharacterized protein LOC129959431 n=1 Tax=Argiope bruennichi TaxID=94029 RepID=UPI0024953BE5|nr:uncharacterized protein LOC129959431 [Argiope bruennichi]XP_055928231.1 uncharacterized protein LOC129959431 [Argiope bruennichi]XP_055928232.1 uncharacterized protein LOC129959431 [Argiope bruennichi]XP_055928233.1 uncharacterized protein LOC129959431 [Argiope bruennichi]XP_055928235.1 uncharacterized protein LOC129959431 [Argiope bruennichi]